MNDTDAGRPGKWVLHLFGDFELIDGGGNRAPLANRKVEALLAVLALHRKYGIDRDHAAEMLWPGKPVDHQRTSFRQALKCLRSVLGGDAIDSSRGFCRLSSAFPLVSDYDEVKLRKSDAFMPGHEGEWFAGVRTCSTTDEEPQESVVSHLLETSRWHARHDPAGMFRLLKACPALARGIDGRDLLDLLGTAGATPEVAGWAAYWRGTSEEDLGLCAEHLRTALSEAKRDNDIELASETCLELGKVYARTGEFDRAMKICRIAQGVSDRASSKPVKINALRLQGIVLTHSGRYESGLNILQRSESLIVNPVELTVALGTRAFFEVSAGHFDRARKTFDTRSKEALRMGHRGIDHVGWLTEAMLDSAGGRRLAVSRLEQLSNQCHAFGSVQFGVYADELLARLFVLEGDKGLAERRLHAAQKARRASQMVVTPLETQLVAALR